MDGFKAGGLFGDKLIEYHYPKNPGKIEENPYINM